MKNGKVAVALLTYNGKQYLPDLFASLEKTQYEKSWECIVVDNASTDNPTFPPLSIRGGEEGLLTRGLSVIRNANNLGFAAGNNVGMRKAIADGAEYVVLLNQDTVVESDWLSELVRAAESDATIGAVQARLMLHGEKDVVNSLGNEIHFLGFGYSGGYGMAYGESDFLPLHARGSERGLYQMHDITYASGAAVLYRAKALRDVGLLDESFFMYHEDLDLGWRLWRSGWKSVLAPASVVYHKYEFSRSIKKYYYMERNRFLVLLENYSLQSLALIFPALVAMELGLFLKAVVSGWGIEKLRAYAYFLRPVTWRMIAKQRKEKQKIFRRPERELLQRFTGVIAFQDMQSSMLTYIANPIFNLYWKIVRRILTPPFLPLDKGR